MNANQVGPIRFYCFYTFTVICFHVNVLGHPYITQSETKNSRDLILGIVGILYTLSRAWTVANCVTFIELVQKELIFQFYLLRYSHQCR